MATAELLMTAEAFGQRPDPGYPEELIRGTIIAMPPPDRRHGNVCGQTYYLVRQHVDVHDLGRVMCNDSAVITGRDPDTVRGADVAYYSYARLPRGPLEAGYGPEVPELVFEVRSAHDLWRDILVKIAEFLTAGVLRVVVLDPARRKAHVFSPGEEEPVILGPDDELTFPGLLEGFRVAVHRFFE